MLTLLTGPGDVEAFSTALGDGVYAISIVPPAPGTYTLELGWITSPKNIDGNSPEPLGGALHHSYSLLNFVQLNVCCQFCRLLLVDAVVQEPTEVIPLHHSKMLE